jgi:hypothetical protein
VNEDGILEERQAVSGEAVFDGRRMRHRGENNGQK